MESIDKTEENNLKSFIGKIDCSKEEEEDKEIHKKVSNFTIKL